MDATQRFSTKADIYAAHRWDYAPSAIDALIEATLLFGDKITNKINM